MAKTPSNMIPLGTKAPLFSLPDTRNNNLFKLTANPLMTATVIMFICNHCPYVKHINKELTKLAQDYIPKNIQFIAINANDPDTYPEDSPAKMHEMSQAEGYPFPYLFDETQEVAKAYQAACTPDFFIFNSNLELVYRGQLDDSRPNNQVPVSGRSIRDALDALLNKQSITLEQIPSLGCNIKWKKS